MSKQHAIEESLRNGDAEGLQRLINEYNLDNDLPQIFSDFIYSHSDIKIACPDKIPIEIFEIILEFLGVAVVLPEVMYWERQDVFIYMRDNGYFINGNVIKAIMKSDDPLKYLKLLEQRIELFDNLMKDFRYRYL